MSCCYKCKKPLSYNEIGAYKKFVNRGCQTYLCKECLAEALNIPVTVIDEKIRLFKEQGCTLFV